jgi:ADP-ribosyl-[dinitrogen reductase] hydrolase
MAEDISDRFRGCLLGVAVGDALGMPVEGYTAYEIESRFGPVRDMMPAPEGHFHSGLAAGQFTDDTEETLLLAESMVESYGFSAERFSDKLMGWGSLWTQDEGRNRGIGFTTRSSVENMLAGRSWKESGLDIPSCGSAMRAAPIGLLYHCDLDMVARYAELQSIPTHCGPAARAGSIAVAVGIALCLQGFPGEMVLKKAADLAKKADGEFADRLLWAGSLLDQVPSLALRAIGNSPLVSETVPAAFYCFMKFGPEEALIAAASGGGDTDSIASIAGSLFGASLGTGWIPKRWLSCLEGRGRIEKAALDLSSLSFEICP